MNAKNFGKFFDKLSETSAANEIEQYILGGRGSKEISQDDFIKQLLIILPQYYLGKFTRARANGININFDNGQHYEVNVEKWGIVNK